MSAGTVIVGLVVSCTVTWNEADVVLPAASLAVQVTVVVPIGNVEPLAGVHEKLVTPTSSVAVAEYVTTVPPGPAASTVMSDGTVTTGGVVSTVWLTVTLNEAVLELPAASLAEQWTVVVPSGNVEPLAGVHEKLVTPTASVAVAV
jgi:hypothetical protein